MSVPQPLCIIHKQERFHQGSMWCCSLGPVSWPVFFLRACISIVLLSLLELHNYISEWNLCPIMVPTVGADLHNIWKERFCIWKGFAFGNSWLLLFFMCWEPTSAHNLLCPSWILYVNRWKSRGEFYMGRIILAVCEIMISDSRLVPSLI